MRHFTTPQLQSRGEHPANITGGLAPSLRKVRVCLCNNQSTSPTSATSDPQLLSTFHASPPDPALHLCPATDSNMLNASSGINTLISHSFSLPPSLSLSVISVHSCGLSPQAVMQSSNSCAQSQSRVGSLRRAGASPQKAQLESNRRGKKRKGRLSQ